MTVVEAHVHPAAGPAGGKVRGFFRQGIRSEELAHPSVHADPTPVVRDAVTLDPADAERPADRLLGSDAPTTPIPSSGTRAARETLGLSPAAEAVLGGTARLPQAAIGT